MIGGTSAVSPLWAGLTALVNQATGQPAGALHDVLYRHTDALRDITSGDNGHYAAGPGWDACTGWGSPVGTAVLELIASQGPTAGG